MPSVDTPEGRALQAEIKRLQAAMAATRGSRAEPEVKAEHRRLKVELEDACSTYRALKMDLGTSTRARVLARDGYRCRYCHAELTIETITFDHVIPWAKGGRETMQNMVICCASCNTSKKDRDLADWFANRSSNDNTNTRRPLTSSIGASWPATSGQELAQC